MPNHKDRTRFYNNISPPVDGTDERSKLEAEADLRLANDPEYKKRIQQMLRSATARHEMQVKTGAGLLCDLHLRFFLNEFNI